MNQELNYYLSNFFSNDERLLVDVIRKLLDQRDSRIMMTKNRSANDLLVEEMDQELLKIFRKQL